MDEERQSKSLLRKGGPAGRPSSCGMRGLLVRDARTAGGHCGLGSIRVACSGNGDRQAAGLKRRRRRLLPTTVTELRPMAAAAKIGFSRIPKAG